MNTAFGVDFIVELSGPGKSRILVDSYYDPFYFQYGKTLKMIPEMEYVEQKDNGRFHPIRLALNKELNLPADGRKIPFQSYETGILKYGTSNPSDKEFDSLTDISISEDQKTIEIRIPWQLINVKDPSTKEVMGNLYENGLTGSEKIKGINIAAVAIEDGEATDVLPKTESPGSTLEHTFHYTWKEWEQPQYYERTKNSYSIMKETFKNAGSKGENQ